MKRDLRKSKFRAMQTKIKIDYLKVLRNMTRGKVRKFRFRMVSEEEVWKKITNLA